MKLLFLSHRLNRLGVPGAMLCALLQRTPVVRVLTQAETVLVDSPMGSVLRSAFTAAASLGAIHSLAGATTFVVSSGTTSGVTVTVGTPVNVAYTINGAPSKPQSWSVSGSIPPGLNFSGLTSAGTVNVSTLQLSGTPTTAGSYSCTLKAWEKTGGTGNSSPNYPYTITVNPGAATAPSITTQPQNQTVTAGGSASFTVAATGSPAPTYQWQKGGVNISGATSATLSLSNVQSTDAGSYAVVVTNSAGSVTSNAATLTVNAAATAPTISSQPQNQTVTAGGSASFSVTASGSPAPTYQWQKGGVNITGATAATLSLSNVQATDAGSYTVVVTNSAGTVTSSAATLTVNAASVAPSITSQPQSVSATVGGSANFSVTATGSPAPTYQWRKGGVNISGATAATLSLTNVQTTDAASYTVVVTNSAGTVTSTAATLTVNSATTAPAITSQPQSVSTTVGGSASFSVTATGSPTPTYQWQKGGATITGATNATLNLGSVQASDAATYTVVVSNSAGTVTSAGATLTVNPASSGPTAWLTNLSVRTNLTAGQDPLIVGVSTNGSKTVLLRGVGPSLASYGVSGALAKPKLELYPLGSSTPVLTNEKWDPSLASTFASVGAFPLAAGSSDAAFVQALSGGYTAWELATGSGIVLVEAYDTKPNDPTARLTNLSARNTVGTGDNILIAGFAIQGTGNKRLLVRAVGPTLASFGVTGTLVDPKLEIYDSTGAMIASNDNWDPSLASTFASVGAFALTSGSKDAAMVVSLPAGSPQIYTVQVKGADGGTGQAIVEIYELP